MTNSSTPSDSAENPAKKGSLTLKERRKWDALVTILIFFLVLIASVLANVLSNSEPLIADTGF
jgi:hypothetical protein